MRSGAKGLGAATFLADLLKGVLAVLVGARLGGIGFPPLPVHNAEALAALCAVLGHMFPIWLGLRGGKGVATAFGVFVVVAPWGALGSLVVFIIVFALSRYVSLASILSSAAFPALAWFLAPYTHTLIAFGVIVLVVSLIIFKHVQNIQRLMAGTEYRFGSGKKGDTPPPEPGQKAKDIA